MKKVLSILLAVVMVMSLLAACGGDDKKSDKEEATKAEATQEEQITLVGTWEYESMGAAYVFNADGTGAYKFAGNEMKFTYTDDNGKLTLTYEGMDVPNEFNYTIEGKTLHIEDSFGSIVDYTRK